jgi:hypothetical protein
MDMRPDLQRPILPTEPLVGGVPRPAPVPGVPERDRDEAILGFLRQRLWERAQGNKRATSESPSEEDKYEPQRLNRKIMWQYDSTAKKVPLLRRPYI